MVRVREVESFDPLDPTELDIAVSALPGCTKTSASGLSDLSDVVLGTVSANEALSSELPSPSFDLSSPPVRPSMLPARSGDESICSGDSRKKNRDWWLDTGPAIVGNSETVTFCDVVAAVSRVEMNVPGCWVSREADDLGAYCGGIASCGGKTCSRWGTVTRFGSTSEVAPARPDVRVGDAGMRLGAKCEGR